MERKSTRQRQESIEVEIIPPHSLHETKTVTTTTSEKISQRKPNGRKRKTAAPVLESVQVSDDKIDECSIIDNSTDYEVSTPAKRDKEEDDKKYCEFCGSLLEEQYGQLLAQRRKYCSPRCRSIATGRRTRARLGVRPTRHEISKLNPLYFN